MWVSRRDAGQRVQDGTLSPGLVGSRSRLRGGKESDGPAGSLLPPREENVVALSRVVPRKELGPDPGEHRSAGKATGLITW